MYLWRLFLRLIDTSNSSRPYQVVRCCAQLYDQEACINCLACWFFPYLHCVKQHTIVKNREPGKESYSIAVGEQWTARQSLVIHSLRVPLQAPGKSKWCKNAEDPSLLIELYFMDTPNTLFQAFLTSCLYIYGYKCCGGYSYISWYITIYAYVKIQLKKQNKKRLPFCVWVQGWLYGTVHIQ